MAILRVDRVTSFEPGEPHTGSGQWSESHAMTWPEEGDTLSAVAVGSSVAPPARHLNRMNRCLVLQGDTNPVGSTPRAEYHHGERQVEGDIGWYGGSFWIPPNWKQNGTMSESSRYRIFTQWHENYGSPPFSFHLNTSNNGQVRLRRKVYERSDGSKSFTDFVMGSIDQFVSKWTDWVVEAKWSRGSDGYFNMWIDGVLVYTFSGATLSEVYNGRIYTKHGIYGTDGMVYFDWWKTITVSDAANYYVEVATPGATPAPEPEPEPTPEPGDILTTTFIVRNANDDAYGTADGATVNTGTTDLRVEPSANAAIRLNAGIIIRQMSFPDGKISVLDARVRPRINTTFNDDPRLTFRVLAEDNPAAWGGARNFNPATYTFLDKTVDWIADTVAPNAPEYVDSPNIAPLLQAALDRPGYAGTIALFLEAHTNVETPEGEIRFGAFETGAPVELWVQWQYDPAVIIPTLSRSTVVENRVRLEYNTELDTDSVPATSDFVVEVNEVVIPVVNVQVQGNEVILSLDSSAGAASVVILDYTPGTNPITSTTGGEAAALTNEPVLNLVAPAVHFDASNLVLNDGDPVAVWSDLSGNDNNAEQPTIANQPTYRATDFNGLPTVKFEDINSSRLDLLSDVVLGDEWTIIMATTLNGYDSKPQLGRKQSGTNTHRPTIYAFDAAAAYLDDIATRTFRAVWYPVQFTNSERALVRLEKRDGNFNVSINSNPQGSDIAGTVPLTVGRLGGHGEDPDVTTNWFNGEIAELLIYNRVLDSFELSSVENDLMLKYDLLHAPLVEIESDSVFGIDSEYAAIIGVDIGELQAPTNFRVDSVSSSTVVLAWDAAPNADAYDLERDGIVIAEDITNNSYTDTGLSNNTDYTYRIRSVKYAE